MFPLKLLSYCKDQVIEVELKSNFTPEKNPIRGKLINLDSYMNLIILSESTNKEVYIKGRFIKSVCLPNYIINTVK